MAAWISCVSNQLTVFVNMQRTVTATILCHLGHLVLVCPLHSALSPPSILPLVSTSYATIPAFIYGTFILPPQLASCHHQRRPQRISLRPRLLLHDRSQDSPLLLVHIILFLEQNLVL